MSQCNAPEAAFFVSALGELMRNGDILDLSFDLSTLAEEYGFEEIPYDDTCKDWDRWMKIVDDHWERLYSENLSETERTFEKKVHTFQRQISKRYRFRVYGELRKSGEECIVLVTEFESCTDSTVWEEIDHLCDDTHAELWVMRDDVLDAYHDDFADDDDDDERQVELSWRIDKLSNEEFGEFLVKIKETTEQVWQKAGLAVL